MQESKLPESKLPLIPAPEGLFLSGPVEKTIGATMLEDLFSEIFEDHIKIYFSADGIIIRGQEKIYPLSKIFKPGDTNLSHIVLDDRHQAALDKYLKLMRTKYKDDLEREKRDFNQQIISGKLLKEVFCYAVYEYSAHSRPINFFLRDNDTYFLSQMIHLEIIQDQRELSQIEKKPGDLILCDTPTWQLFLIEEKSKEVRKIEISRVPFLQETLDSIQKRDAYSYFTINSIKRILLSDLSFFSVGEKQKIYQSITQLIGSIVVLSFVTTRYSSPKKANSAKYRLVTHWKSPLPGWDQDQFLLREAAFISTSDESPCDYVNTENPDNKIMMIYYPQAVYKDIRDISAYSNEREHLFPPGEEFLMKKLNEYGPWITYQALFYSSAETLPHINSRVVENFIDYIFNNFLKLEYQELNISDMDTSLDVGGKIIYRPNYGLAHAIRNMEMVPQLLLFFAEYCRDPLAKNFYKALYANKFSSTHTGIALLLLSLDIGQESDVSRFGNLDAYTRYRHNSFKRFCGFFTQGRQEFKDYELDEAAEAAAAESFIQFMRPISEDSDEHLRKQFQIYKNILIHLGDPAEIAKMQGEELYLMQIANMAQIMDSPRYSSRKSAINTLSDRLKTFLTEEGLKKIPQLVDYAIACIQATGDRMCQAPDEKSGARDYNHEIFARCSTIADYCQAVIRQVPVPLFVDWPVDPELQDEVRLFLARQIYAVNKLSACKFLPPSLLLKIDNSPEVLLLISSRLAIEELEKYINDLKEEKTAIYDEKGVVSGKFLDSLATKINKKSHYKEKIIFLSDKFVRNILDFYLFSNKFEGFISYYNEMRPHKAVKFFTVLVHFLAFPESTFEEFLQKSDPNDLISHLKKFFVDQEPPAKVKKIENLDIGRLLKNLFSLGVAASPEEAELVNDIAQSLFKSFIDPRSVLDFFDKPGRDEEDEMHISTLGLSDIAEQYKKPLTDNPLSAAGQHLLWGSLPPVSKDGENNSSLSI